MASWEIEVTLWKNGRRAFGGHAGPIQVDRIRDILDVLAVRAEELAYAEEE